MQATGPPRSPLPASTMRSAPRPISPTRSPACWRKAGCRPERPSPAVTEGAQRSAPAGKPEGVIDAFRLAAGGGVDRAERLDLGELCAQPARGRALADE